MRGAVLMLALAACAHAETLGFMGVSVATGVSTSGKPSASRPIGQLLMLRSVTDANYIATSIEPGAAGATSITGFSRRVYAKGKLAAFLDGQGGVAGAEEGLAAIGGGGGFATLEFKPDWFAMVGAKFERKAGVNGAPASNQTVVRFSIGRRF